MEKTTREQYKILIKKDISNRLGADICDAKEATEVLDALAYACTFSAPRTLAGISMEPKHWSDLATTLTLSELQNVTDALPRFSGKGNKLFYILGCFARIYKKRLKETEEQQPELFEDARVEQPEILKLFNRLPPEQQNNLLNYARGMVVAHELDQQKNENYKNKRA